MTLHLSPAVRSQARKPALLVAVVLVAALAIGVAGALMRDEATPPPDQLRVEALAPAEIAVAGGKVSISGVRSRSETRISISLPAGVLMISAPVLEVDGERLAPRSSNGQDGPTATSFAPTDFGEPVTLRLGTLAAAEGGETAGFVLDVEALLARVGDDAKFELPAGVVLDGPRDLLVEGEQGNRGERPWVGVVVRGAWNPEHGQPVATDAAGVALKLAHVQVGYTKDANGQIFEGTTAVGFFVDGDPDLSRVSIVLGPRSTVDPAPHSVTLVPAAD